MQRERKRKKERRKEGGSKGGRRRGRREKEERKKERKEVRGCERRRDKGFQSTPEKVKQTDHRISRFGFELVRFCRSDPK